MQTQIKGSIFRSVSYYPSIRSFWATVQSEYRSPAANEVGIPVRWKLLVNGATKRVDFSQSWSETGSLKMTLPKNKTKRTKVYRVAITMNEATVYSHTFKIRGHKKKR